MSETKQVKVDNWGIYFLQRLKHFFNRTDYCDLTLQFQDNAQLKVHRLVLSACTEYFELLERTCEMYEDCLVMPDDLQADVVVPIVNFMYTGQLEFRMELLERLYQTSEIMNMPVLTKLLKAQRVPPAPNYSNVKRYTKVNTPTKQTHNKPVISSPSSSNSSFSSRRIFTKSYDKADASVESKTTKIPYFHEERSFVRKKISVDPRPTRYELPEELDGDNVFESSFSSLSYDSKPLMVHPEAKQYSSKHSGSLFSSEAGSKRYLQTSTLDIVECKRIRKEDSMFDDSVSDILNDDIGVFTTNILNVKSEASHNSNQLFDKIMDSEEGPKVTIETKDSKKSTNIDHAKIISEVLKKYPHLMKSNKNIKLKILDKPQNKNNPKPKHPLKIPLKEEKEDSPKGDPLADYTYETEVLDSKAAAKLIAMGADNVNGPWICLICGTPGRALHFSSYYKFRRHLVEVHNEKPVSNMCEYCGLKSQKRNYLLHHLYTKHDVEPPPQYKFPKCNICNYVALTEGFLVKHKLTHTEIRQFRCNVCSSAFHTTSQLLSHIQLTGHKYSAQRTANLQCIYCLKQFLREPNLYAHLKTSHKLEASSDGIIDVSDDEDEAKPILKNDIAKSNPVKFEPPATLEIEYDEEPQYQIHEKADGNIHVTKKLYVPASTKQKILNPGYKIPKAAPKTKTPSNMNLQNEFLEESHIPSPPETETHNEEIVIIGDKEYIMRENQLIPKKVKSRQEEFILSDMLPQDDSENIQPVNSPITYNNHLHNINYQEPISQNKMMKKQVTEMNQPFQIVVSNEEEYKALMASNHPIMFDDTNSGKTLTVLTTPHASQLNTAALGIDTAQSNEMMIIQQEYQMNPISETIPMDNPNIVVVYSHSADHQNKPYQIITSQGLGAAQIIQSSAMITQNYGGMATATPVMNAQIIDQHAQIWQNNIQHDIGNHEIEITSEPQYQEMTVGEQTEIAVTENESNALQDLPEVHLMHEETQTLSSISNECEENINKTSDNLSQSIQTTSIEETQNPSVIKDQNLSDNVIEIVQNYAPANVIQGELSTEDVSNMRTIIQEHSEHTTAQEVDIENPTMVVQEQIAIPVTEIQIQTSQETNNDMSCIIADPSHENLNSGPFVVNSTKTGISELQVDSTEYSEEAVIIPVSTPITKEQIQNITSEWSDDDEGATPVQKTKDTSMGSQTSTELEESVENIQQEIENAGKDNMIGKETAQLVGTSEDHGNLEYSNNESISQESEALGDDVNKASSVNPPLEKISSLLNDWEENDSQEDTSMDNNASNISPNDKCSDSHVSSVKNDSTMEGSTNENSVKEYENSIPTTNLKADNIKSLVSDWDEEDEENKE